MADSSATLEAAMGGKPFIKAFPAEAWIVEAGEAAAIKPSTAKAASIEAAATVEPSSAMEPPAAMETATSVEPP